MAKQKKEKLDALVNFNTTASMKEVLRQATFYKKMKNESELLRHVIATHPDTKKFIGKC
jgi:hypothetical protein